mmetsp:Transcript_19871/g.19493  ORF Transcript_19871/g.19493 Transcript_19871/m.19493 type:complete len:322 (+) Transcript_19871:7-972(+)
MMSKVALVRKSPSKVSTKPVKRRKVGEDQEKEVTKPAPKAQKAAPKKSMKRNKKENKQGIDMTDFKAILRKPKRNITSYAFFIKEKKNEFIAGRSTNKIATVLMKEFGQEWSSLTKEQKEPYNHLARQDKVRYEKEIKEFTKKCGSPKRIKELENKRPKKALSSYMIFVRETRAKVCEQYPEMHALEVMKKVGQLWQKLDSINKKRFDDQAQVDKQRFLKELEFFQKELDSKDLEEKSKLPVEEKENSVEKGISVVSEPEQVSKTAKSTPKSNKSIPKALQDNCIQGAFGKVKKSESQVKNNEKDAKPASLADTKDKQDFS